MLYLFISSDVLFAKCKILVAHFHNFFAQIATEIEGNKDAFYIFVVVSLCKTMLNENTSIRGTPAPVKTKNQK